MDKKTFEKRLADIEINNCVSTSPRPTPMLAQMIMLSRIEQKVDLLLDIIKEHIWKRKD